MRVVRRSLDVATTALLVVLAALSLLTAVGLVHVTPVLSGSMRPHLQPGDAVLTRRVPVTDLKPGDVVVFGVPESAGGGDRVHRLVDLTRTADDGIVFHSKGDANSAVDPWTANLHGHAYRVVARLPYVGWVVDAKAHGLFLWVLLAVAVLCLAGGVRWCVLRAQRRREGKATASTATPVEVPGARTPGPAHLVGGKHQ